MYPVGKETSEQRRIDVGFTLEMERLGDVEKKR